jgi:putative SOS response-associated peptidase YedK
VWLEGCEGRSDGDKDGAERIPMCGRYTHHLTWTQICALYELNATDPPPGWHRRFNLAPGQDALVIRLDNEGQREAVMLGWGLVPFWANEPKSSYSTINARDKTMATKLSFRGPFKRRRCIVPASGFYEWRAEPGHKGKQPYHITRADGDSLSFAGLWDRWQKGDATRLETFTIVVGDAHPDVRKIHDRSPVILERDQFSRWLDPSTPPADASKILACYRSRLKADAVSKAVLNARNEYPELLTPIAS